MNKVTHAEAGFTLVELLVSLALLALLSAYSVGALSLVRKAERVKSDDEERAAMDAVARHFRQVIADTRVLFRVSPEGETNLIFDGQSDSLSLIAATNDELETNGLYRLSYSKSDDGDLMVERRLYRASHDPLLGSAGRSLKLLDRIDAIGFRYFGSSVAGVDADWQQSWTRTDQLPQLIEISIKFEPSDSRAWPRTIVPVEAAH